MKKTCVISCLLLAMAAGVTYAQKPAVITDNDPGWKRIGQVTASFKKTNESIIVLGEDEFTAIRLKANDAPIQLERVQVFYETGDMEELNVRNTLQAGASTAAMKLSKPYRDIQKVAFTYKTLPNTDGEKADLELFGLKTDQDLHPDTYIEKKADQAGDEVNETARETEKEVKQMEKEVEAEVEEADRKAEDTGDEAGDEISETAAKVMADIKDKKHHAKVGPRGQVIFISDDGRYYYINNEGNKVWVNEIQLKDKPRDN
jgi:hypothetical protein